MKGSVKQNVDYCSKDVNFLEFGTRPVSDTRSDLQHLYRSIALGQTDRQLLENGHFPTWSRSLKAVDRVRSLYRPKQEVPRIVELHIGATNTGKTRQAFDRFPDLYETPVCKKGDLWFDGYDQEEVCLIDEFSGQMPLNTLLKICDPYYVRKVPYKGGFVWWNPKRIIITSNVNPRLWYKWEGREEQELALRRRFNTITTYTKTAPPVQEFVELYWPHPTDFLAQDANPVPVEQLMGPPVAIPHFIFDVDSDESS